MPHMHQVHSDLNASYTNIQWMDNHITGTTRNMQAFHICVIQARDGWNLLMTQ